MQEAAVRAQRAALRDAGDAGRASARSEGRRALTAAARWLAGAGLVLTALTVVAGSRLVELVVRSWRTHAR